LGCWASWDLEEDDSVWGRDQDKARRADEEQRAEEQAGAA
jgi:hypothetical protein